MKLVVFYLIINLSQSNFFIISKSLSISCGFKSFLVISDYHFLKLSRINYSFLTERKMINHFIDCRKIAITEIFLFSLSFYLVSPDFSCSFALLKSSFKYFFNEAILIWTVLIFSQN